MCSVRQEKLMRYANCDANADGKAGKSGKTGTQKHKYILIKIVIIRAVHVHSRLRIDIYDITSLLSCCHIYLFLCYILFSLCRSGFHFN